jgi:hypothetical protein
MVTVVAWTVINAGVASSGGTMCEVHVARSGSVKVVAKAGCQ